MKTSRAFTLVEVVVVVLILGVLATVAASRVLLVSDEAGDSSLKQSLTVIRDAIENYKASNGKLPGADGNEATFKSDLAPYLRRGIPVCPVGSRDDLVKMVASGAIEGESSPTMSWRYYFNSGSFITNYDQPTISDPTLNYDEL